MLHPQHKIRIFIALCVASVLWLGGYLLWIQKGEASRDRSHLRAAPPTATLRVRAVSEGKPRQILFRYTGIEDNTAHYGKLTLVDADSLDRPHFIDDISCEAVHFASGRGICLAAKWGAVPTYYARIFDAEFQTTASFPLKGTPSRTRVSPDGKLAGLTVFLSGHSYATVDFTTETLLIDLASGESLGSVEDYQFTRDGLPFRAADFNLWGVSFTPDSRAFYCTLSSNRKHYLVRCDIASRTGTVVHENVECPSVSPDGLRVAYKKRLNVDGRLFWQLHVLDLATKSETPLAEKRSVDDQLEWLDEATVLYAVSDNPEGSSATTNVWKADATGETPAEIFLRKAYSPGVVR